MLLGGIRHDTLNHNARADSVSGAMLYVGAIGIVIPSMYYHIYGSHELGCQSCEIGDGAPNGTATFDSFYNATDGDFEFPQLQCSSCNYSEHHYPQDNVYTSHVESLMYSVSGCLIALYLVGLLFTLKTHRDIYADPGLLDSPKCKVEQKASPEQHMDIPEPPILGGSAGGEGVRRMREEPGPDSPKAPAGGHEAPSWSIGVCAAVMLVGTGLFAFVSEVFLDALQPTLEEYGISEEFAGLTVVALVPCLAEFANAIQFARENMLYLSIEIGNVAGIQMMLVQIPVLVFMSAGMGKKYPSDGFVLLYPPFNLFAILASTFILTKLLEGGRTNYFRGASLVAAYIMLVMAFYHIPDGKNTL